MPSFAQQLFEKSHEDWRPNMRVIGISPLDKDSNVSFLEDGRVVFACGGERLTRVQLQGGSPDRAWKLAFERAGWDAKSIDAIAYAFFDWDEEGTLILAAMAEDTRTGGRGTLAAAASRYCQAVKSEYRVDRTIRIPGLET